MIGHSNVECRLAVRCHVELHPSICSGAILSASYPYSQPNLVRSTYPKFALDVERHLFLVLFSLQIVRSIC